MKINKSIEKSVQVKFEVILIVTSFFYIIYLAVRPTTTPTFFYVMFFTLSVETFC